MTTLSSNDEYHLDSCDGDYVRVVITDSLVNHEFSIEFQNGYELDRFIRRLKFERNEVFGR